MVLAFGNLHGNILKLLLIVALGCFGNNLFPMNVLLECEKYLVGIHRLDEIIGNLRTNSLVHDVFFFALCHHNNGRRWRNLFDFLQRLKSRKTWHHLIEEHKVECLLFAQFNSVRSVRYGDNLITFFL